MTDPDQQLTRPTPEQVTDATEAAEMMRKAADELDRIAAELPTGRYASRLVILQSQYATAVAAWLRSAADDAEQIGPDPHATATATARAILGEV